MNISISDHCHHIIFEQSPLTIDGVCIATNIAGEEKKYFKIRLLSHQRSTKLIESGESGDDDDENMENIDIEELRQLRHSFDRKAWKRLLQQLKVNTENLILQINYFFCLCRSLDL